MRETQGWGNTAGEKQQKGSRDEEDTVGDIRGGGEHWGIPREGGPHRGQAEAAQGTAPVVDVVCVPELQPAHLHEEQTDRGDTHHK